LFLYPPKKFLHRNIDNEITENYFVFESTVHNLVDLSLKKNNSVRNTRKSSLNHFKKYLLYIQSNYHDFYDISENENWPWIMGTFSDDLFKGGGIIT
jgi:hypothetical protein